MYKNKLYYIVLIILLSCSSNLGKKEYYEWISKPSNGLVKEFENNFFKLSVQYKPVEYMVATENKREKLTNEQFQEAIDLKNELQYFNIKIESKTGEEVLKTNIQSEEDYYLRTNYFLGDFENDLLLIEGKDTLSPVLYHFERTYGALPFNTISIAFKNISNNKYDKEFLLLDRALGFDLQQFFFLEKDINNIPGLKIK